MYTENRIRDTQRFFRAVLTDWIARIAPNLYIKLTRETGRGGQQESAEQIADYFTTCFYDYFQILGVEPEGIENYLAGKRVLEYGPGDIPGVGLLMLAYGAESVVCVDRFSLYSLSAKSVEVLQRIVGSLPPIKRLRVERVVFRNGHPESGFADQLLRYVVNASGLSDLRESADLIISRAVLEHVNDLSASFADMSRALRANGVAVHLVDLSSHGLHDRNPLDFLKWSQRLWSWMYGHKGYVNRWRIDQYRELMGQHGFETVVMKPSKLANMTDVTEVRPYVASCFRNISDEDLSCLGLWIVCRRRNIG